MRLVKAEFQDVSRLLLHRAGLLLFAGHSVLAGFFCGTLFTFMLLDLTKSINGLDFQREGRMAISF